MKIFIDDERHPKEDGWVVVRTGEEYLSILHDLTLPIITHLSFDHDLGEALDGYDLVKSTVALAMDAPQRLAPDLSITIHTANTIGQNNMTRYIRFAQNHGIIVGCRLNINFANSEKTFSEKS